MNIPYLVEPSFLKWITIYRKKHWGGMTLKHLEIAFYRGLIYRWNNGGLVRVRRLI